MPRSGGSPVVIFESETSSYVPLDLVYGWLTVRDVIGGTISTGPFNGGEFVFVSDDPAPGNVIEVRMSTVYYRDPAGMLRSMSTRRPSGSQPVPPDDFGSDIVQIDDSTEIELGLGTILWKRSQTVLEPLTLVESLRMLNETTGCVQDLPSLGLSISLAGLDAEHVYWKSYNGLDGVSPGVPYDTTPLMRVNLRTGALESITAAGFEPNVTTDYLAQNDSTLYFRVNDGLVAVAKP